MNRLKRIVLFVFALACLVPAAWDFASSWSMASWPVAPGRVVTSETRQTKTGERYSYSIDIEVEYTVNGARHVTRSIRADSARSSSDRSWADRVVGRYSPRRAVPVHYRPGNPAEARVEIQPLYGTWMILVWGISALFCGWWTKPPVRTSGGD